MDKKRVNAHLVANKRAAFDYEILETWEGGLSLLGTEVKSLRNHGGNLSDAYLTVSKGEVLLVNASIAPYKFGNLQNHLEKRARTVLLHKREIRHLDALIRRKGFTLIPLELYLKNGRVKVRLACCKGKRQFDKRQALKTKEEKRQMDRTIKEFNG